MGLRGRKTAAAPAPDGYVPEAALQRAEAIVEAFDQGINDLIDTHAPDTSAREHAHPDWSYDSITFHCTRCRVAWPCPTINDLRRIYGEAHGFDRALIPYEPLLLRLTDED